MNKETKNTSKPPYKNMEEFVNAPPLIPNYLETPDEELNSWEKGMKDYEKKINRRNNIIFTILFIAIMVNSLR